MLVLTRRLKERIFIGDDIVLTVTRIHSDKVSIGIEAPKGTPVHREEVRNNIIREGKKKGTV